MALDLYTILEKYSEKKHIIGLMQGSYQDFQVLYDYYAPMLYGFSLKMTKSTEMAKEIVQVTFIKIWAGRTEIRVECSFKSFLFTMAKNLILNKFRDEINNPLFDDYMLFVENERVSHNTVEDYIYFEDLKRSLSDAKKRLTNRQREIFEQSREYGMQNMEIAQKLHISEQTVKNVLSGALKSLRTFMSNPKIWCFFIFIFNGYE